MLLRLLLLLLLLDGRRLLVGVMGRYMMLLRRVFLRRRPASRRLQRLRMVRIFGAVRIARRTALLRLRMRLRLDRTVLLLGGRRRFRRLPFAITVAIARVGAVEDGTEIHCEGLEPIESGTVSIGRVARAVWSGRNKNGSVVSSG